MALVNGGFLHCNIMDMKKFLKNLLFRNCWSDFEIISQESGFDIIRYRLSHSGHNCYKQAAFTIFQPARESKILVHFSQFGSLIANTGSFWSLRSDKQMDIKLFTEFL